MDKCRHATQHQAARVRAMDTRINYRKQKHLTAWTAPWTLSTFIFMLRSHFETHIYTRIATHSAYVVIHVFWNGNPCCRVLLLQVSLIYIAWAWMIVKNFYHNCFFPIILLNARCVHCSGVDLFLFVTHRSSFIYAKETNDARGDSGWSW